MFSLDDQAPPAVYVPAGSEWVFNKVYQESVPGAGLPVHVDKVLKGLRAIEPKDTKSFKGLENVYQGIRTFELEAIKDIFTGYANNDFKTFLKGSKLKSGFRNPVDDKLKGISTPEGAAVIAAALAKVKQQINTILVPAGTTLTKMEAF